MLFGRRTAHVHLRPNGPFADAEPSAASCHLCQCHVGPPADHGPAHGRPRQLSLAVSPGLLSTVCSLGFPARPARLSEPCVTPSVRHAHTDPRSLPCRKAPSRVPSTAPQLRPCVGCCCHTRAVSLVLYLTRRLEGRGPPAAAGTRSYRGGRGAGLRLESVPRRGPGRGGRRDEPPRVLCVLEQRPPTVTRALRSRRRGCTRGHYGSALLNPHVFAHTDLSVEASCHCPE